MAKKKAAKKKAAKKKAAKNASAKKQAKKASKKRAVAAKQTSSVAAKCPSCGFSVSLDGCTVRELVECLECASELEVVKKGSKLGLSLEHSDSGDDFPQCD
jgi:lysine biosynthesis protein LysW